MYSKFGQFIDGKWQNSSSNETYEVINPANEFLTQIQSPYDSITRFVFNAIPLKWSQHATGV